jgi:hypothetical protein
MRPFSDRWGAANEWQQIGNGPSRFTEDAATGPKFHGSYQQDECEVRTRLPEGTRIQIFVLPRD